eukprot:408869_1
MSNLLFSIVDFSYRSNDLLTIFENAMSDPKSVLNNTSDPIYFQLIILLVIHIYTYTNGILFDWSGVDRLWSVTPVIYAHSFWVVKYLNENIFDTRLFVMATLISLWGVRLTINFAIKGGYGFKHEDYRWKYVRKNVLPDNIILREIFHIGFVNIYQHFLIWSFTLPMYLLYANKKNNSEFDIVMDGLFSALWFYFFILEVIADKQMFTYQTKKYEWYGFKKDKKNKNILKNQTELHKRFTRRDIEKYEIGFFYEGLYAYARHTNYFGEQGMWVTIYLWSAVYCGHNWSLIGSLLLIALFQGSVNLAETMSSEKYPLYRIYQQKVSSLMPWIPSNDLDDALRKKVNVFY